MKFRTLIAAVLALAALVAAGCGGADDTHGDGGGATASSGGGGSTKLSLVAYSTPQVVYDEVIPAFRDTAAGKGVSFSESFGASGDQSRAVESGLAADVVAFSLAPDMTRLVKAGLVAEDWAANDAQGPGLQVRGRRSSCARATRRASTPGTTCSSRASRC